jgi:peptide chain release factor subunit 3
MSSNSKETISVVFLGSTHAGKSTVCGQILVLTGQVDDHTLRKSTDDAVRHNHKESALANLLNTTDEEREAARTVELGRAEFDTTRKHCILLDAPGHRDYIPSMIQGASMADVGVLVVSARIGEFEAGLDGGQTKEHVLLAKTLGLQFLIVLVSKMDDPSVAWKQVRYDEIVARIQPLLKSCGFVAREIAFLPASAQMALNLHEPVSSAVCPWLVQPRCLFQMIDDLPSIVRDTDGPLRISVRTRYRDMGAVFIQGKVESGHLSLQKHKTLLLMPTRTEVQLHSIVLGVKWCAALRCY